MQSIIAAGHCWQTLVKPRTIESYIEFAFSTGAKDEQFGTGNCENIAIVAVE